jgi:hypothetical protein
MRVACLGEKSKLIEWEEVDLSILIINLGRDTYEIGS